MTRYYGKWSTNGNKCCEKPYESENKNSLMKQMIKLAYANRVGMQACYWSVWHYDECENKIIDAEGGKGFGSKKWKEVYNR